MNEPKHRAQRIADRPVAFPAYPYTGQELFDDLKGRVARELGVTMTMRRLARIMGAPLTSTFRWFEEYRLRQVLGFMLLLERLPNDERQDFVGRHCRDFPCLSHPRLDFTGADLARLSGVLAQGAGLTFIHGEAKAGTFLLTALAHSWSAKDKKHRSAIGIDLHSPSNFVPVENVTYIDPEIGIQRARSLADRVWPRVRTSRTPLLVLNGIWSVMPELRRDILRLAESKHVIIAQAELPSPRYLESRIFRLTIIAVSQSDSDPARISVRFRG